MPSMRQAGLFRECRRCQQMKPIADFYVRLRSGPGIYERTCIPCWNKGDREWYALNKKKVRARYDRDKDRILERKKRLRAEDPIPHMLAVAKSRAKKKGLPFSLKREDITVPDRCPVFGLPLRTSRGRLSRDSPSLDRIHNSKGYVPGNVIVVSLRANHLKLDATIDELRTLVAFYEKVS